MAWITTIDPNEAEGELDGLYRALGSSRGGVARVHLAQSLNPRAIKAHLELYKAVVFARSTLSRIDRERLAVVVSAANRCDYCIRHHGEALRQLGNDPQVAAELESGQIPAGLGEAERALLTWAARSTRQPASASEEDVQTLRRAGYDDRAILDATLTVAYFNFVNRIVLMLGVDLEEGFERLCGDMDVERATPSP
jgi:uncharacterized peroxidase-related enzyme